MHMKVKLYDNGIPLAEAEFHDTAPPRLVAWDNKVFEIFGFGYSAPPHYSRVDVPVVPDDAIKWRTITT
jgi:hypothetical protein